MKKTVLVTGAAGGLGVEVCGRLAQQGAHVIALVHTRTDLVRNDGRRLGRRYSSGGRIEVLQGDITQPHLGLSASQYGALQTRADMVVHGAAVIQFGLPRDVYRTNNVGGTENVLAMVRAKQTPLVHVSTAYVAGNRHGLVREDELDEGQDFGNHYEESKLHAELLVREAGRDGVPYRVVRPSIIVGRRSSGAIRDFSNIYVVLKLVTSGRVRTVPALFDAVLDLVPVDYVADIVCEVANRPDLPNGFTCHAVGAAMQLNDMSTVLAEYPSFGVPRYLPPENFDVDALDPRERQYHKRFIEHYLPYMQRRHWFDASAALTLEAHETFSPTKLLRTILNHCIRVGYLGPMLRRVERGAVGAG